MSILLTFVHISISALLIISILMQASKGGGLSGAFGGGGGGMNAAFGGRGAGNFLTKATTVLAILFMLSNMGQVFLAQGGSALPESAVQRQLGQTQSSPASSLPGLPVDAAGTQSGTGTTTAPPDTSKNN